jgi:hypothetical protein
VDICGRTPAVPSPPPEVPPDLIRQKSGAITRSQTDRMCRHGERRR